MKKLYLLLLITFLFGCKKEEDAEPTVTYGPCLITRIEYSNGNYSAYQYDENRGLKSFFQRLVYDQPFNIPRELEGIIVRDKKNRISKVGYKESSFSDYNYETLEYDNQGQVFKSNWGSWTRFFLYNSEGIVHTTIDTLNSSSINPSSWQGSNYLEYEGGNLVRTYPSIAIPPLMYEYYLDKEAKQTELHFLDFFSQSYYWIPWLSIPSKHLLRKTQTRDNAYWTEFTYELNEHGYPTKIISKVYRPEIVESLTEIIHLTYMCD